MARVVLVGLDDPYGKTPLQPDIPGSSGQKLWRMSGLAPVPYVRAFRRVNLFKTGEKHTLTTGRRRAFVMVNRARQEGFNTYFVCLGRVVGSCFYLRDNEIPLKFRELKNNVSAAYLPHPSGLNRWYNSADNAEAANKFMRKLAAVASGETEDYFEDIINSP